jgi:hypothetical protein
MTGKFIIYFIKNSALGTDSFPGTTICVQDKAFY